MKLTICSKILIMSCLIIFSPNALAEFEVPGTVDPGVVGKEQSERVREQNLQIQNQNQISDPQIIIKDEDSDKIYERSF